MTSASLPRLAPSSRRRVLGAAIALGLACGLGPLPAAAETTIPVDQLMAPGALPDAPIGAADAPITIVEYASMTCTHCAAFHEETWPTLKSKYVDTGKVRFILREFPLDPLAAAGFMLARCAGAEKRNAIVDLLYTQQKSWAFTDKPIESLAALVKQAGISQSDFEACLNNQALYDQVKQMRDHASDAFKIKATPTFFVNGQEIDGEQPIDAFDKVIEPLLK